MNDQVPAKIAYWWDASDRSWVVAIRDAEDNQIGDAQYSGTPAGRDYDLYIAKRDNPGIPVEKLKRVVR